MYTLGFPEVCLFCLTMNSDSVFIDATFYIADAGSVFFGGKFIRVDTIVIFMLLYTIVASTHVQTH